MQSDELNKSLYPCRFCGTNPTVEIYHQTSYGIRCANCHHIASPISSIDFEEQKKYWNARNEKHNPFLEKIN